MSNSGRQTVLIDVSRLVWRFWRGGLPTGVDRVCLAYVDHYQSHALAVVQRRGRYWVLNESGSKRLFQAIQRGPQGFRRAFTAIVLTSLLKVRRLPRDAGHIYLNVGHTGLNEPSLGQWIAEARVRAIFLVHDLIPILHPEYCRAGEHRKHERRMENALRFGSGIIANSEATLRDLRRFAETRGLAAPPAVVSWIAGSPVPRAVAPKDLGRPYFIVVGTIEGRKNHELLLQIWRRLTVELGSECPLLVIVGQRGWQAEAAISMLDRSEMPESSVVELNRCEDAELASLIAGARALLMPSFAEGFGLPVIEALELGAPVIASNLPVFREIAGDVPTYLDPFDRLQWQREVVSFIGDGKERKRQLERIHEFRAPNWPNHFVTIDRWIETVQQ